VKPRVPGRSDRAASILNALDLEMLRDQAKQR
jgi:hypothetical protein